MDPTEHPLFPLSTVVFPGGILPMRIFEPRYLDMVSHCMRQATGFVVCAARPAESGGFAAPRASGTRVSIADFDRLDDGALGITVHGHERVSIHDARCGADGLWWGRIAALPESADGPCPIEFAALKDIVAALIEQTGLPYTTASTDYSSASWLSARLTELLPFDAATKHQLLSTDDPIERLRRIRPMVEIENTGRSAD
ncbi:LON peptidase substrate-binding domain-containing protein [Salinisphaera sp. Q1T1-3]|uniref:LON peptidase substrate-binding domain-containing protein n=1 Tax=Salinisphaera sp. Q1T1-3 TaxID=2321229 RepID=UPI000E766B6B|nr:LON peptidase substrate-binding domain-containing protein [Salinisphaera sp. Q1T1-3]RJS92490.1 peptidase S16 [Salinisphaera sp. Q1T1-3]